MNQLKTLADFFAKMQTKDYDDAKGSIKLWRSYDKKWYVAARIADNWIVVSTTPSANDVKNALNRILDLAVDVIDAEKGVVIKFDRDISLSDFDNEDCHDTE